MNRHVRFILIELVNHINMYYISETDYHGPDYSAMEYNHLMKKWAAKEFYLNFIDKKPQTPTDLYLISDRWIQSLNRYTWSNDFINIAHDVAIELYDFIAGVL